jgi:hypothetical protein
MAESGQTFENMNHYLIFQSIDTFLNYRQDNIIVLFAMHWIIQTSSYLARKPNNI